MKKNVFAVAFLVVAGGWWIAARPGDIVTDLGLTTEQVQETTFTNVTSEEFSIPYSYKVRQLAKKIPEGSRATAVQALGAVVRSYASSADFKNRYQDWLKNKYQISDDQTRDAAQNQSTTMNDVKSAYNQQAAMVQNAYSQMPPSALAMMIQSQIQVAQQELSETEGTEKTAKTQEMMELKRLQALSKTKPEEFKKQYVAHFDKMLQREMAKNMGKVENDLNESKQKAQEYQKRLADYKAAPSVHAALKQRLTDFIALAGTVDFDAQLTKQGYKMEFVNPQYRNQSSQWKLLFRMGKEPVLAARSFAQTWVNELEKKK
ncbi:hypothetical protein [Larkinella humicola]|uniref:Uncharacterized protein n=1 Tax=Larkinella humicola TaxID=2607654 RepID=A0A5N1JJV4_9BACT|nr:hypothetical protein [Larkinella humicola]KAA9356381.1 hypothetical protein F0P93_01100 [Larkinella humicola]